MDLKDLKYLWNESGFHPVKSMGQNFLVDKNVRNKIISAFALKKDSVVLEIGTGFGMMTFSIAEMCRELYAVEKDRNIAAIMAPKFEKKGNIRFIEGDILDVDVSKLAPAGSKVTVVGNIPYYISTPIIEKMIEQKKYIGSLFLVMQDDLANRIVSKPGSREYGSVSCFVQFHAEATKMFKISSNCFCPRPVVDSCLLRLVMSDPPKVKVKDQELMFKIIHLAFWQRRKKAVNPLSTSTEFSFPRDKWIELFERCGIKESARAEEISLVQYAALSDAVSNL